MGFYPKHFLYTQQQGRAAHGFTLIELLITIAILAIILAMAAPSFNDFVARSNVRNENINLQADLRFAAAQARSLQKQIGVKTLNGRNNWGNGYHIWVDTDKDGIYDENTEMLLREKYRLDSKVFVKQPNNRGRLRKISSFNFRANGMVGNLLPLSVELCLLSHKDSVAGRGLQVLPSGTVLLVEESLDCSAWN
jgi:prepilin-type N-terminal cleavage/methylation domain-containing protein